MTSYVRVLDTIEDARGMAMEWEALNAGGASSVYTSAAWCLAAWRSFPDLGSPCLIALLDGSTLQGVLPLAMNAGALSWAGSPLGDEHDARLRPGPDAPKHAARLLTEAQNIADQSSDDQAAFLRDVRPNGVLTEVAASERGCPAPILRLAEPDQDFGALSCIPGWSRHRRRGLRSARRQLGARGSLVFDRMASPDALAATIPEFVAARLAAWRSRGRWHELPAMDRHPRFPDFLAEATRELAVRNQSYLARLSLGATPIAQSLLFRATDADLLYMSTYQPSMARYSPSHLLLAEIAQAAWGEGLRVIELGRGDEGYKFDLGARSRHLRDLM